MAIEVTLQNGEVRKVTIPSSELVGNDNLEECDRIDNWLLVHIGSNDGWRYAG